MTNDVKTFLNNLNKKENQVFAAQQVFTNKICELLGITTQELNECVMKIGGYRFVLYLPSENIYLIASQQHLLGWNIFFHITKENVCIHNISQWDAFDLHRSQGTSSYSFTADQTLINKIYKSIERKNFKIITINN